MPATKTGICNLAMVRIGQYPLFTDVDSDTGKAAALCRAVYDDLQDEVLRAHPWKSLAHTIEYNPGVITAATLADPVVLTVEAHGFLIGDVVTPKDVVGMTELNELDYVVSAVTTDTITLTNAHGAALVDAGSSTTLDSKNLGVTDSTVLQVGEAVSGTNIPAGTKVTALSSPTTVQMDNPATATGGITATFGGYTAYTSGGTITLKKPIGYARAYRLPTDYLRPLDVTESYAAWTRQGDLLLTDALDPVEFRYVRRLTDPLLWDALLVTLLAARIAIEVVEPLTQSNTKKDKAEAWYAAVMTQATMVDAQESSSMDFIEDPWINVRRG